MGYGYYGGYGRMAYSFDWTWLLLIAAVIISMIVQAKMRSTFSKYSQIAGTTGMTGAMVARKILESEGIYDVQIGNIAGSLTDHYDPRTKIVNLSETVYGSTSLAAVGVAAHECGHAIQHARGYKPLEWRSQLVPAANIGSKLSWPLFLFGLILSVRPLLYLGIIMFCAAILFQIVTLPVEFNASSRALAKLSETGIMRPEEITGSKKVLQAAAMTYVAAAVSSLLQLVRLIAIAGGGRRRN